MIAQNDNTVKTVRERCNAMRRLQVKHLAVLLFLCSVANSVPTNTTENPENQVLDHSYAEDILQSFEKQLVEWGSKKKNVDFNYETNLTDENLEIKLKTLQEASEYDKKVRNQIMQLKWQNLQDDNLKRQFCKLSVIGPYILPDKSFREAEEILSKSEKLYNTLTVCDFKNATKCNLTLIPDLTDLMAKSRDPEELKHIWVKWHDLCGKTMLPSYPKYVELLTQAGKLHNYTDMTSIWLKEWEFEKFPEDIDALWQQVKPFYSELHTHVRKMLRKQYGDDLVSKDQAIPSHLLGDMWAQKWVNIANFTAPYVEKKPVDVTDEMIKQGITVEKMYHMADDSFVNMGMIKLPDSFWQKSIFTKPTDRPIVCDSPVRDFLDGKTYAVNTCDKVSMANLLTAYTKVGNIQYYMQYKDQRYVFRKPPNMGFLDAIGGLLSLSVITPSHLEKLGLLKANVSDPEVTINNLYYKALNRVVNLPYAYVTEKWRWDVFQNKINTNQYNCHWWKLSEEIQGIKPPVERSKTDFDAGSEYHIAVDYTYLRYFVSSILQFQLHKNLCMEIGEYKPNEPDSKPLHLCDITSSTQAGKKLKAGMKLGSSKPWQDILEKIIGERKMDASGLLEYFKPLHEWLKTENAKTKEHIGWNKNQKDC